MTSWIILSAVRTGYAVCMRLPTLDEIRAAQQVVYRHMSPTPQYTWPLLNQRLGTEAWIKHENHTAAGAFKIRGALVYLHWLLTEQAQIPGVIAATRGNHGQGVGVVLTGRNIDRALFASVLNETSHEATTH